MGLWTWFGEWSGGRVGMARKVPELTKYNHLWWFSSFFVTKQALKWMTSRAEKSSEVLRWLWRGQDESQPSTGNSCTARVYQSGFNTEGGYLEMR